MCENRVLRKTPERQWHEVRGEFRKIHNVLLTKHQSGDQNKKTDKYGRGADRFPKCNSKFSLSQAMKAQRGRRSIALPFL